MFYAGIGWSDRGYSVMIMDQSLERQVEFEVTAAARTIERLAATLRQHADPADGELGCFVDSSNGALADVLVESGLAVYRLDPQMLATQPATPGELARAGHRAFASLERLTSEDGFLRGRADELGWMWIDCLTAEAELHAAGRFLAHGDRSRPEVALTFDDGPHPEHTERILDVLRDFGVPATFFCIGLNVLAYPGIAVRALSEGHRVANHSWSHAYLPDLAGQQLDLQVRQTADVIAAATGLEPTLFRLPYGSRTPQTLAALNALEQITVSWDVDSWDWSQPGASSIVESTLSTTHNGSVILLHDGGGDRSQTVEALPRIIESLLERGMRLVTVDDLVTHRGSP